MTGSGKTTLLKNIITQDIARFVGPPEDRHHIPIVVFDGKGDLEFFEELLPTFTVQDGNTNCGCLILAVPSSRHCTTHSSRVTTTIWHR